MRDLTALEDDLANMLGFHTTDYARKRAYVQWMGKIIPLAKTGYPGNHHKTPNPVAMFRGEVSLILAGARFCVGGSRVVVAAQWNAA